MALCEWRKFRTNVDKTGLACRGMTDETVQDFAAGTSQRGGANRCELPSNADLSAFILKRGHKISSAPYLNARVDGVVGLTADQALGIEMPTNQHGKTKAYSRNDLKYDLERGFVMLVPNPTCTAASS